MSIYQDIQNFYNMDRTTWQEVLSSMYNGMMSIENGFNELENRLEINLPNTIKEKLNEMVTDGTLESLINGTLFQGLNDKFEKGIADVNTQLDDITNIKKTVYIPTDYATLEEALKENYKKINTDEEVEIVIKNHHYLTKGLLLKNGDYSRFKISSENDEIVRLATNFVGYNATTIGVEYDSIDNCLIIGINCTLPTINCKFDMGNKFGDGVALYGTKITVTPTHGVINSGRYGIYAKDCSMALAINTDWSGSNSAGLRMQHASNGMFARSKFDGCCKTDSTLGSVYISKQCICQVRESTITNNTTSYGLLVRRSRVDVEQTIFNNCFGGIQAEGGSVVSASACEVSNITSTYAVRSINSIIIGTMVKNCLKKHFYVASQGQILSCRNEKPNVEIVDCEGITTFNSFSERGMISPVKCGHSFNELTLRNSSNVIVGKEYTFYDRLKFVTSSTIVPTTINANGGCMVDTGITIPEGYELLNIHYNIEGRTTTEGGGGRIAVNCCGRDNIQVYVINTGLCMSGVDNTVRSVIIKYTMVLKKL